MEVTAKELREKPGQIIEHAARGAEVVITLRGKKKARLVSYRENSPLSNDAEEEADDIFGMWNDKDKIDDVAGYVRALRKGRTL